MGIALGGLEFIAELEVLVAAGPIRGLGFASMISPERGWFEPSIEPLAAVAARSGLTVNLLCSPAWLTAADEWIERHPELTIVVDHLGRPDLAADLPQESACDNLAACPPRQRARETDRAAGTVLAGLPASRCLAVGARDGAGVWPDRLLWVRTTRSPRLAGRTPIRSPSSSMSRWTCRQPTGS